MTFSPYKFSLSAVFVLLLVGVACASDRSLSKELELELEDQYGKKHIVKIPPADHLTVFVLADRKGSSQVRPWVEKLYGLYGDDLVITGIAVLPEVPRPIQSTIKTFFRQALKQPLLLDWGGKVASYFEYQGHEVELLVVNHQGEVRLRVKGMFSTDKFTELRQAIDDLTGAQPKRAKPRGEVRSRAGPTS